MNSTPRSRRRAPAPARLDIAAIDRTQVVIVGGGINGLAAFRDLALQGVDVLVVDKNDFSSGASAASSHMVHGGLRYLENGELRLVQESVRERNSLLMTAPHRITPLPTTIPLRKTWSGIVSAPLRVIRHRPGGKTERGAALAKLGLTMYDSYSRRNGSVPAHQMAGKAQLREQFPDFAPDIRWAATYYDASVGQPERVAIDLVKDGERAHRGARALNYAEVVGMDERGVRIRDRITGVEGLVSADVVVNASGPWTDLTNEALGEPTSYMGGNKGSHIVVDSPELLAATRGHEIFFEHPDGRIVLIYPLHGRVMIGTSDIPVDVREPARCTQEEVDYFLELVGLVFPDIPVSEDQIVYRFAGIRPLPRAQDAAPGVVSRDYRLEHGDIEGTPVLSIVGGKWTTFRALGERVTDAVLELLKRERVRSTLHEWIGGGRGYPKTQQQRQTWIARHLDGFAEHRQEELFTRYGTRAADVAQTIRDDEDAPIPGTDLSTGEVAYLVHHEYARHISDVVQRRTTLAFRGGLDRSTIEAIGEAMAPHCGWTPATTRDEVDRCMDTLATEHGVRWHDCPAPA